MSAEPKAGGGKAPVTLETADVKAAYEAELDDMKKMNDPMDKKTAAFVAKVGKPEKDEGGKKTWHAVEGTSSSPASGSWIGHDRDRGRSGSIEAPS